MRVYDPSPAENLLDRLKRALRGLYGTRPAAARSEFARMLADAGLSWADVKNGAPAEPRQRRRMAAMMRHFGVDPETADPRYWGALRDAQRVCVECRNESRCHRWLTWGRANDAPRVFCPNAALLDEVAIDARNKSERTTSVNTEITEEPQRSPR